MNKLSKLLALAVLLLSALACQSSAGAPQPAAQDQDAAAAEAQGAGSSPVYYVPESNVNCRMGPAVEYALLEVLTAGQQYLVLGVNADGAWLYIQAAAQTCWVKVTTGQVDGDIAGVALVEAPPPPSVPDQGGSDTPIQPYVDPGQPAAAAPAPTATTVVDYCSGATTETACALVNYPNTPCKWVDTQAWCPTGNPLDCTIIPAHCTLK